MSFFINFSLAFGLGIHAIECYSFTSHLVLLSCFSERCCPLEFSWFLVDFCCVISWTKPFFFHAYEPLLPMWDVAQSSSPGAAVLGVPGTAGRHWGEGALLGDRGAGRSHGSFVEPSEGACFLMCPEQFCQMLSWSRKQVGPKYSPQQHDFTNFYPVDIWETGTQSNGDTEQWDYGISKIFYISDSCTEKIRAFKNFLQSCF